MTQATLPLIRRLAMCLDFRREKPEKAFRLAELLDALDGHPDVRGQWVLKGGTALNLYRWDIPRLSEDADINYIGALDRDAFLERREPFLDGVRAVARELGYTPVPEQQEQRSQVELLRYRGVGGEPNQLRFEVNFLERLPLSTPESLPVAAGLEIDARARVLCYEENVAGKMTALGQRNKARDLLDTDLVARESERLDTDLSHALRIAHFLYEDLTLYNFAYEDLDVPADWNNALLPMVKRDYREPASSVHTRVLTYLKGLPSLDDRERQGLETLRSGDVDGLKDALHRLPWRTDLVRNPAILWRLHQARGGVPFRRKRRGPAAAR